MPTAETIAVRRHMHRAMLDGELLKQKQLVDICRTQALPRTAETIAVRRHMHRARLNIRLLEQ